jgi:glutathione synthase/RimK-type ligase-like ATP-grasp enzyme
VGEEVFAAAIYSQTDPAALVDWRQTENPELPHHHTTIPDALADRLRELLRMLGLSFGAIDLVKTPEDDYVFLEVNPSGQWLWLDDKLDLGITRAVATWLATTL